MFEVFNLTNTTVIIPDLRIEIGPRQSFDLTLAASREDISNSKHLQTAIATKKLGLGRHTVIIRNNEPPAPPSLPVGVDENKIKSILRDILSEQKQADVELTIQQAISSNMNPLLDALQKKIDNIGPAVVVQSVDNASVVSGSSPVVDPAKIAEIQQKSLENMTQGMESSEQKPYQKIVIKSNLKNIADQL